jgi:hypothetical protein
VEEDFAKEKVEKDAVVQENLGAAWVASFVSGGG